MEYHFMFIVVGGNASVKPFGTFSHTPLEGSSSIPCWVPFCDVSVQSVVGLMLYRQSLTRTLTAMCVLSSICFPNICCTPVLYEGWVSSSSFSLWCVPRSMHSILGGSRVLEIGTAGWLTRSLLVRQLATLLRPVTLRSTEPVTFRSTELWETWVLVPSLSSSF